MIQNQVVEGFRLSPQQKRLWALQERDGMYHTQSAFVAEGSLDRERLRRSFLRAVGRHEVFRTIFHRLTGMDLPIQVVRDDLPVAWTEIDLPDADNQDIASRELFRRDRETGFDLENGPLVRMTLARLSPDRHLLCLTTPTLCGDLRTHHNLVGETGLFYGADGDAEAGDTIQYVDFSEWQHELLTSEEAGEAREIWRGQFPAPLSELSELRLPFENGHGPATPCVTGRVASLLGPEILARVERLAGEQRASAEAVLLAAWLALLSRSGLPEDLCVGRLHAGRKYDDLAGAHGLFARCLPLRFRLDPGQRFTDALARVERVLRQADEWQEYFSWDDLAAGDAHLPYGFEYRQDPGVGEARGLEGARLSLLCEQSRLERFAIQLKTRASARGLELEVWHDAARVEAMDAERLLGRLEALLGSVLEAPAARLSDLAVLNPADRRLIDGFNDTAVEVDASTPLHRIFETQAARTPAAEALIAGGDRLTFRELNERANRLARHLVRRGTRTGSRVVIALERSAAQIVTLLAAWKAGAAFVPVDPLQPAERLARMLEDVSGDGEPALIVTAAGLAPHLPATPLPVVILEEAESGLAAESPANLPLETLVEAPAYVIFTSGSTGRPKGAVIHHAAVANLAEAMRRAAYTALGATGTPLRVSVNAPLAFDGSIKQIVQLLYGHALVLVSEEVRPDAPSLVTFLRERRVDVLDCTPAQLGALLDAGLLESSGGRPRLVLIGGEKIPVPLWERLTAETGRVFYNLYGPTECTVDTTVERVGASPVPSIGRPLANVRAYVTDENQQATPPEVWGELLVGGAGLSIGYLGRPDLTAERFIPDPFGREPGGRLYRTGDRVRLLREGRLVCQGRFDHQVKLRGFRIELGEIEAVLAGHPGVSRAVALVREDVEGMARLVAYVSPRRSDLGGRELYRLPNGLRVAHQNQNETEYLYREIFQNRCYALHGVTLPPDACVFDVGANIGMFTLFVHQECVSPRVYAFEPLPAIFDSLSANCGMYAEQVKLFPFGLSERERRETFTYYPRYSMMSGQSGYARPQDEVEVVKRFLENQRASGVEEAEELLSQAEEILAGRFQGEEVEVRLRRLSDVIRQERVGRIDLLKIDVQRAEMDVLHGLDEEHWPLIRQVVLEVHDAPGDESEGRASEIRALLERRGFAVVVEQDELLKGTDRYNVYAVRPEMERAALPAGARTALSRWLESGEGAGEVTAEALRELARRRLPDYMVPSAVVVLPDLPLTRNGKIDRAALPAPEELAASGERAVAAPRNPFEEVLAGIWADVLGHPRIGIDESFFDLGGHSLLATQLVSRVREVFRVELPLRALFEGPTIAHLAERVETALQAGADLQLPPIQPVPRDRDLLLSFAQQRLWFLWQLEPESPAYNSPKALRIRGPLDVAALERTLDEIVRRHEVLRTTFPAVDGRPVQRIDPAARPGLPVHDLTADPDREERARAAFRAEAQRPFDLASEIPVRTQLLVLGPQDHVLLLTTHHIVSDAWSVAVLEREVTALYQAFSAGEPSPLPELPVQYADFAQWQREWLRGEVLERQLAYWRGQLAGAPPVLELPLDRPRPTVASPRGEGLAFALPAALSRSLDELSRRRSLTPFMTLLAGFQVLLARSSGQTDVSVGTPIAGRRHVEIEGLIGFFVNTLVMRGPVEGTRSFDELLDQTRETALQAYAHQDLPFERLVDELSPERSLMHTPLFQAMLVLQNVERDGVQLGGLDLSPFAAETGVAKLDLLLSLGEEAGVLRGELQYRTGLFDRTTIIRLADHLVSLLESAAAAPQTLLSDITLLAPAERHQLLTEWNDTAVAEVGPATLPALFAAQVARSPQAVAVTCGEESLTYAELDRRAGRLAQCLRGLSVGPEVRVGLCAERSLEMVVGLLGVLKAGGAYVPLDPSYPDTRLAVVVEDARPQVVLTQQALRDRMAGLVTCGIPLLDLAVADGDIFATPRTDCEIGPENAAYVLFTSGSTGRPKGVINTHRGIVSHLLWMQSVYGLTAKDRVLQKTPFGFDVSVWEFFWPLMVGARLVVACPGGHQDSAYLQRLIRESGITHTHFVPSMLRAFLEEPRVADCTSLRRVIASGETLPMDLVRLFHERLGQPCGTELYNLYGPTEAAVDVTWHACRPGEERVPIGRPVSQTQIRLLDAAGQLVPTGVAGELHIGGMQVGRGYLGRPDLTAERFVPDPFGVPGARLYRTGDLARYLPDGEVEFLGRIDHQVKLRGFRIELGEIETALLDQPEIREAVVVLREDHPGDHHLVAYVAGDVLETAVLRQRLSDRLPAYMVPSPFVWLDALPLNSNGKIDRRALPEPGEERAGSGVGLVPRGLPEEVLSAIWSEVLGIERVGREDDFFALGGHSLLATQAMARVREAFGIDLPLRALFEQPTLSALAGTIEDLLGRGARPVAPPLTRAPRNGMLPASFAQQRLWLLDQIEPGSSAYNIPLAQRLLGALDVSALEASLAEVVRRHESLRTTFAEAAGTVIQVIAPVGSWCMPRIDLSAVPEERRNLEVRRLMAEEAAKPFDLAHGPVFRALLVHLAPVDHVALVTMHHIASDGWSVGVLAHELGSLYGAFAEGRPSPLSELPAQYADYAAWQRGWLEEEELEAHLTAWCDRLRGTSPRLELPTDRPRPVRPSRRGRSVPFALSSGLSQALRTFGRSRGATPFMVLLAVWQFLLSRLSGQDNFCVGTPIAGRTQVDLEPLIGFFVNTLVLQADLSDDPSLTALLDRVREICLDAYLHQAAPFEKLVERLTPQRSLDHTPLFQVMFGFQNTPAQRLELPGLAVVQPDLASGSEKFDLSLMMWDEEGACQGTLSGSVDLFDQTTIERLVGCFQILLEAAVTAPDRIAAELSLLSDTEKQELEREMLSVGGPTPVCVHTLFEEQVRRRPEAAALVFGDEVLTYQELDARAERIALRLLRRGVGPEARVAVLLERSVDLVAGLLGVLKAGGVFVPLDPHLPTERLAYFLDDSGASVLLTHGALPERLGPLPQMVTILRVEDTEASAAKGLAYDRRPVRPEHLTYLMYTSGSTGRPKGVMVEHGSLATVLCVAQRQFAWEENDSHLALAPFSFDIFLFEVLCPLIAGARCVLAPAVSSMGIEGLIDLLTGVTRFFAVPSLMRQLVDTLKRRGLAGADWRWGLRTLFSGGEAVPAALLSDLREVFPAADLVVLYGPTEATIFCTAWQVPKGEESRSSVLGQPVESAVLLLCDLKGNPVPPEMAGEIWIGGPCVARGYLGLSELTTERFVPSCWAPGLRFYRTGDLARRRPDGVLEFLGRIDHQVKIRGFRIELGEIEAALESHPDIHEVVVVAREEEIGDIRLVAYVVPAPGAAPEAMALRESLANRLPDYMIPAAFILLAELPRTAHGKLDRRALPEPSTERPVRRVGFVPPQGAVEEVLATLWAEVLRVEKVSAEDDFFALGGHSLLATQVMSRAREIFGIHLPLRSLFEHPTLAALAREIEDCRLQGTRPAAPPIASAPRDAWLPASFAQQRLWFLDQLRPGISAYNVPIAQHLLGRLNARALEASLSEVIRRHDVLRTTFAEIDGRPVQVIAPPGSWRLPEVDMSALTEAERVVETRRLAAEEALRPFDLRHDLPFRASLLHLDAEDHVVLVTMHHIATDGWSVGVFARELTVLYEACVAGLASPLPDLPLQYADYAAWQRTWLDGEALEAEISYWREHLRGAPPLAIPTDRPRPERPRHEGARLTLPIPGGLFRQIAALGRSETCTPFMILLAAFGVLLSRTADQEDFVLGVATANRTRAEIEGIIGFFINMLPLRLDLAEASSFRDLLQRVREVSLGAFSHQEVPLDRLIAEVHPHRISTDTPLFQVAFGIQNAPNEKFELSGLCLGSLGLQRTTSRFDLTVWVSGTEEDFLARWTYSTELFNASTIQRLHDRYVRLLESIVERPDAGIDTLEMIPAAERQERMHREITQETSRHARLLRVQPKKLRLTTPTLEEDVL